MSAHRKQLAVATRNRPPCCVSSRPTTRMASGAERTPPTGRPLQGGAGGRRCRPSGARRFWRPRRVYRPIPPPRGVTSGPWRSGPRRTPPTCPGRRTPTGHPNRPGGRALRQLGRLSREEAKEATAAADMHKQLAGVARYRTLLSGPAICRRSGRTGGTSLGASNLGLPIVFRARTAAPRATLHSCAPVRH